MIPSTGTPFAMTRWAPMTQENSVGTCPYLYQGTSFHGFIGTHQPAVWMGESGEVVIAPGVGAVKTSFADRALEYSHVGEISSPHYYKTILQPASPTADSAAASITAELTATSRVGRMRFTFDTAGAENDNSAPYVVMQATRKRIRGGEVGVNVAEREIFGTNPERQDSDLGPFTADDFKGYFVARFDTPFASFGTASGGKLTANSTFASGDDDLAAYVQFDGSSASVVNVVVGVSFISYEMARASIRREAPEGSTLEDTAAAVEALWAEKLDRVTLTSASADELAIFYTSMYHALQYPSEMMEYDANGTAFYYSGFDNAVHEGAAAYTGYSIWDTFRAEWAFINLFAPERVDDMITSMLHGYVEGGGWGGEGRLPIWQNIVETNIMIGTHSSSLIAESLAKGFRGFDLSLAWEALWKDATVPPDNDTSTMYFDRQPHTGCEARAGLTKEKQLGWVAAMQTSEAGSRTLEYAYDDYTVAVAASILGHTEESSFLLQRSKNYRNIFNNDTMFMQARYENGSWCADPTTWTEADEWVYTFNVQHDFPGLRDLLHGPEGLEVKLDAYYDGGHNDQTNEPSHATVFAYLYADQPAKAQAMIRRLLAENYFNTPVGISGNDDCGQMAAWYVFNAMGFYPVNPASAEYMIGTPLFDRVEVRLPRRPEYSSGGSRSSGSDEETSFVITAAGARDAPYVGSVAVDGTPLTAPVLHHSDLLRLHELAFDMYNTPQEWGKGSL